MIDFATLKGLTIPEGVVTKIEVGGKVLWAARRSNPAVLQVEKITTSTYVGETTYADESFILLDIYPKPGGTVNVTYGGVTKTITDTSGAEEPNAQQVFFGTFNGVADDIVTPDSGELVIDGDYKEYGVGSYTTLNAAKNVTDIKYCGCVSEITDFGDIDSLPSHAFDSCESLTLSSVPNEIVHFGNYVFANCSGITSFTLPEGFTTVPTGCFDGCVALTSIDLPDGITEIGAYSFRESGFTTFTVPASVTVIRESAFEGSAALTRVTFHEGLQRIETNTFNSCTKLDYVHLPTTLTYLGARSLAASKNEDGGYNGEYNMHGTVPPEMGLVEEPNLNGGYDSIGAFGYHTSLSNINGLIYLHVPSGCGDTYKSAPGWSLYAERIIADL